MEIQNAKGRVSRRKVNMVLKNLPVLELDSSFKSLSLMMPRKRIKTKPVIRKRSTLEALNPSLSW
jgi:hypothetical protein